MNCLMFSFLKIKVRCSIFGGFWMKKVLIVITTSFGQNGGLATVMMNYYKNMNRDNLVIDFASTNIPDEKDKFYSYIVKNGANYFCLGNRKNLLVYIYKLMSAIKKNNYDIIHVNGNSSSMFFDLFVAKFMKIPLRIAHVHSVCSTYKFYNILLSPFFNRLYCLSVGVSKKACDYIYNHNDYIVLNNAIDLEKFSFNENTRIDVRNMLNVKKDDLVVGHVGRFSKEKNHSFLIDVFYEVHKKIANSILVLVGKGPLEDEIKKKISRLGLENYVVFLGYRHDVNNLYQAFDVFIFPSKWEGLGFSLIEAQCSGLLCVASSNLPEEVRVTNNISLLSLDIGAKKWAEKIQSLVDSAKDRELIAIDAVKSIIDCGFDIKSEANKLREIWEMKGL